jgi:hypothetical protein
MRRLKHVQGILPIHGRVAQHHHSTAHDSGALLLFIASAFGCVKSTFNPMAPICLCVSNHREGGAKESKEGRTAVCHC